MPTIEEIMQYASGRKNLKPLVLNNKKFIDEENELQPVESLVNNYDDGFDEKERNKNLVDELIKNSMKNFSLPNDMQQTNTNSVNNNVTQLHPAFQRLWNDKKFGGINKATLKDIGIQNVDVENKNNQDVFNDILAYNNGLKNRTNLLHGARTAANLGVLLNNIMQPDGDSLPTQINLTRPDLQYDDTIRRKMVSEAGQQSNVAQMNAMKLGMREAIPAINSNMLRATNDVNTQAQANINEIHQKNAMLASDIANKEIEGNLTLNEKRIQDALMKNELRNKAISGQTDTTFRDLGRWQQQSELIKQENNKAGIYRFMADNPSNAANNLILSYFGADEFNTPKTKKNKKYDNSDYYDDDDYR